ncbi:unnamed protein product, partial [marine sediment metagenome]
MASVTFTSTLKRHIDCPSCDAPGETVCDVLDAVFATNPKLRGYIVDEQGACRQHIVIFVDGEAIRDQGRIL